MNYTDKEIQAATEYLARNSGGSKPEGTWDNAGRWFPSEKEDCGGLITGRIRTPSRAWPRSYWNAAKSLKHVAALYECDEKLMRKLVKKVEGMPWISRAELEARMLDAITINVSVESKGRRL